MAKRDIAKGDIFRVGEIWESPKGTLYKVMSVELMRATLRGGSDGSGRIVRRPWDSVVGWIIRDTTAQEKAQ